MTNNEIIKANEEIMVGYALKSIEPFEARDVVAQMQETIDRLKSENERLKSLVLEFMDCVSKWSAKHDNDLSDEINKIPIMDKCRDKVKEIKSEAYKEFAERLLQRKYQSSDWSHGEHPFVVEENDILDILEKMGCDNA